MKSIRSALTVRLTGSLLALLALFLGMHYATVKRDLTAQFDAALTEKARVLSGLLKQEHDQFELDLGESPMPEFERTTDAEYFQIWLTTNRVASDVFMRSRSLAGRDLPGVVDAQEIVLPDGRPGRVVGLRFEVRMEHDEHPRDHQMRPALARLVLARSSSSLDRSLDNVRTATVALGLMLLMFVPVMVSAVAGAMLRPLRQVAQQASEMGGHSLGLRFQVLDLPAELNPIVTRLNDLLERLSAAFDRERRFSADVAHELRTPIAELRALAEVALQAPETPTAARHYQDVLGAALQMEKLVTALLTLARCESGRQPVTPETLDLGRALADAWAPLAEKARLKNLKVTASAAELLVTTDKLMLASILSNLLANAVEYAPSGGALGWTVTPRTDGVEVTILNTNDGLEHADLDRAFEPFWRKDAARSDGQHGGLGLSLVAAFARLIGAQVRLGLAGGEVHASLLLPRAGGPAARPVS